MLDFKILKILYELFHQAMALADVPFTGRNSMMRISRWATAPQAWSPWPTMAQTPTAHSSTSFWKTFCCEHRQSMWFPNFVSFALTVSEKTVILKLIFFFTWPPFCHICPDFCQKLIRASFKYIGCSYKILNCFVQPFGLYCGNKIFFKVLNLKPYHWWKLKFNHCKQYST